MDVSRAQRNELLLHRSEKDPSSVEDSSVLPARVRRFPVRRVSLWVAVSSVLRGEASKSYARLAEVPRPIDMVEIFRNSEAAGPITDEALALDPLPKVIWMQLGVRNDAAAERAEARGVTVVMNRCPKIEYGRLSGEIGWSGVNSRTISSRKPVLRSGYQHLGLRPR